jgi:hypothetical protein
MPARVDLHFTATVRLARTLPTIATQPAPVLGTDPEGRVVEKSSIYRIYFHGPAYQVLDRALLDGERVIGVMAEGLPPNDTLSAAPLLMAPRLIELCFQTAGVYEMATAGVMALPLAVGSVTTYRQPEQADGARLYALVTPVDGGAAFDAQVIDDAGNVYVDLHGYRTVQLPGSVNL